MIRQEPKVHFLYENLCLDSFPVAVPSCEEVDFAAFEDIHAKSILRITKNADLEIRLRRDGPPEDQWLAKGVIRILVWNDNFQMDGFYPATFCNEKPSHMVDLMSCKALKSEVGDEIFNVDVSIKFDKWEGLKVLKLFQFDHEYLDSNLNLNVQGHDFYVRSKTIFKEIPALREYLEQNFEPGTKKYVLNELQAEKSVSAFETMLQVAFRCSFMTTLREVGEVLALSFRFDYPLLKRKCEYYLINEPESEWFQKLVFADLYDLPLLRKHVLDNTVGLRHIQQQMGDTRFLSTDTLRAISAKVLELKDVGQFEDAASTGWPTPNLSEITENRWNRLKRIPLAAGDGQGDVTAAVEKFETTFVPKHFGVELITPDFCFAEKTMSLFSYKVQLGPDHRLLFKLDWNNLQHDNFVWSVEATVLLRMQYLGTQTWQHTERVRFDYDHQSIFFDGLHIQKVFPGGVEHLLDGLGSHSTLPNIEILVGVEKVRGLELEHNDKQSDDDFEEMDDEWILQPARTSPVVCCGKYLYVDKEVLRAKSAVFAKIFEQKFEPITIPMAYDKFNVFANFLDVLHGDEMHLSYENVFALIEIARSFQVREVLDNAVEWLADEPATSHLQKLQMAEAHAVPEIQNFVLDNTHTNALFEYLRVLPPNRRLHQMLLNRLPHLPMPEEEDD